MKLDKAESIANKLVALLQPACNLIAVAGSIRRRKAEPRDLEIVCVPWMTSDEGLNFDLFGPRVDPPVYRPAALDRILDDLVEGQVLAHDHKTPRNGSKYKRFIVKPGMEGEIALDLFICEPANFGNIYALRTGNAEFSKALVTPRRSGGLMPGYMAQRDGYLWRGSDKMSCPTEELFFEYLGIRWVEPQFRTVDIVRDLLRHAVGGEA